MPKKPGLSAEQYGQVNQIFNDAASYLASLTREIVGAYGVDAESTEKVLRAQNILERLIAAHAQRAPNESALAVDEPAELRPFTLERHRQVKVETSRLLATFGKLVPELIAAYGHSKEVSRLTADMINAIIALRSKLDARLCDVTTSEQYATERYDYDESK